MLCRYAAGATIQIILFGILAVQIKMKAPSKLLLIGVSMFALRFFVLFVSYPGIMSNCNVLSLRGQTFLSREMFKY